MIARSGVKLTAVSQTAVASLIELQSDMLTSALSDAALRLERASRADNVVDLVRDQIEMIPATRARIVEDAQRAVTIFKAAGRDLRGVATNVYEKRRRDAAEEQDSRSEGRQAQGASAPCARPRPPRLAPASGRRLTERAIRLTLPQPVSP